MTMPCERTRAVLGLADAVRALAPYMHGKSSTVRVPRETLRQLQGWLRHYPSLAEMQAWGKTAPAVWAGDIVRVD